jgi:hypothetical protein
METALVEKLFDQALKRKLSQLARASDPNLWSQIASNKVDREYFSRWKWRLDMTVKETLGSLDDYLNGLQGLLQNRQAGNAKGGKICY